MRSIGMDLGLNQRVPEILRRQSIRLVAVILAGFPAMLCALTTTDPLDIAGFVAELDRVAAAVAATDASGLAELRTQVPERWVVREGSVQFDVPAAWIAVPLQAAARDTSSWPDVRTKLLARIASVRTDAQSLAARPVAANGQLARVTLQEVLARPEFAGRRSATWIKLLKEQVSQWLLRFWQRMGGERLGRRSTAIALAWIAALAALFVLSWWLVSILVRTSPGSRLHLLPAQSRRLSARAWAQQAVSAADPREAARCAYHAAVRRLEEEGAWRVDDARTPREYLRLLPSGHGRRTILTDMTYRFEQIWYGGRTATADDMQHVIAGLKDLGCLPAD
jgi:hypothetical protein